MDKGAQQATIHRVKKSRTQLKRLSACTHPTADTKRSVKKQKPVRGALSGMPNGNSLIEVKTMPDFRGLKGKEIMGTLAHSSEIYLSRGKVRKRFVILCMPEFCKQNEVMSFNDALILFFFNIYLFGRARSQLRHQKSLVAACGIQFPEQGSNPSPCIGSMESQPLDTREVPNMPLFQKISQPWLSRCTTPCNASSWSQVP